MVQEQLNDKLKDMADDDDLLEDVDVRYFLLQDMLAEIEGQLKKDNKQKVEQKTVEIKANVNTQKQKQKQAEENEISKMMAEL